jgi:oligopeptide/dipeptide ABC transporter ATP-binding protein
VPADAHEPPGTSGDTDNDLLLETQGLTTCLATDTGIIRPVNDVDLQIRSSETLAVVGESGSGKSMLAYSLMKLLPAAGRIESGAIFWKGRNVLEMSDESLRRIRGREIALVFQEASAALNPVRTVGDQIAEPLRTHLRLGRKQAKERAVELLEEVQLKNPAQLVRDYPHQLSGGMKQRVMIAMAIACDPDLVIADEPTTALDATLQKRILELLERLKEQRGLSLLLITHDLSLVKGHADRVAVMYAGRVVEDGPAGEILEKAGHPYTQGLWRSLPKPRGDEEGKSRLAAMEGTVPHLATLPPGCAFEPRCPDRFNPCRSAVPSLARATSDSHRTACYLNPSVLSQLSETSSRA